MALAQIINIKQLANQLNTPDLIIFDCRFSLEDANYGHNAYIQGHIPNAIYVDLDKNLSSPVKKGVTGRHPLPNPEQLTHFLAQQGLNNKSKVVIYDDGITPFATRLWWSLMWLGKKEDVYILNGGFSAWKNNQLPISQEIPKKPQGNFTSNVDHSLVITADELEKKLGDKELTLLDARVFTRFAGKVEPIDPIAGHIPGASCANYLANLDQNGYFLSPEKLQQRFKSLIQDRPLDKVIAYCGSGVTACHNLFSMCLAGYPLMPLYAGSWSEWITNPKRSIAHKRDSLA